MDINKIDTGWYIVLNPKAGGERALNSWHSLRSRLSTSEISFTCQQTKSSMHAIELVRQGIEAGFRRILAIGGDGTINECINGIFQQDLADPSDVIFSAIPVGTGSDWAKMYALPREPDLAIRVIQSGREIRQDIGKLTCQQDGKENIRYFDNIAGLGYDAYVTKKTSHLSKRGLSGQIFYFKALLAGLFAYHPVSIEMEGDNFQFSGPIYSANVAICRYNGGGMRPAPLAIPDDGLFDITLIEPLTLLQVLSNLLRLYNGTIYRHPKVSHYLTRKVRITSSGPSLVEVDGEVAGNLPAYFEILPQALRILVPNTDSTTQR